MPTASAFFLEELQIIFLELSLFPKRVSKFMFTGTTYISRYSQLLFLRRWTGIWGKISTYVTLIQKFSLWGEQVKKGEEYKKKSIKKGSAFEQDCKLKNWY